MIDQLLEARLLPVWRRRARLTLLWRLAAVWAMGAVAAGLLFLILHAAGRSFPAILPLFLIGIVAANAWILSKYHRTRPDWPALVKEIEARQDRLDGRLTTALEQKAAPGTPLNFLQQRLILETLEKSFQDNWGGHLSNSRFGAAISALAAAVVAFGLILGLGRPPSRPGSTALFPQIDGLEVTPGDISLERGQSLVVLARFSGRVPASAELILRPAAAAARTQPLVRSLKDPVFGGTVPEVSEDLIYSVQSDSRRSPEFKVKVFEFPRLERADADLTYPAYTQRAPQHLPDTRRVSAVEGTRLALTLQLNKPVRSALLVAQGTNLSSIPLEVQAGRATAALTNFPLASRGSYELQLIDPEGRTNRVPSSFVFEVSPNRRPELKLLAPKGDVRPSPLEEITFNGTVWDDFGVLAYGLAFSTAQGEPQFVELGRGVPGDEKRAFEHLLRLEERGVVPDDLVAWFVWADDLGPDGNVRRTQGDLFFAEIRPFEELYREGQNSGGGNQGGGGDNNSPSAKLAELQKQIINATWKLERDRPLATAGNHARDVAVVSGSQSEALDRAKEQADSSEDPRAELIWGNVLKAMEQALSQLVPATNKTDTLTPALTAEKAAYQALLKLREREFQVTRGQNQSRGGGSGEQMRQRQLDQLDFSQNENRYETQREAQAPASSERREQLQVLSRLDELARRQDDLNQRLKEVQAELQAADTEKAKEEARRQLKRLQEEQQQMLADADELRQRLNREENQSRFSEQRQQLENTRQDLQKAAQAAGDGSPSQAVASGTRAQQQLQQMREKLQRESSSQFTEELRSMRQQARELSRREEEISKGISELQSNPRKSLSANADPSPLVEQLNQQQARLTNLVAQATQLSQAAEATEPIASRQLYDTLRQLSQDETSSAKKLQEDLIERRQMTGSLFRSLQETGANGPGQSLDLTEQLLKEGLVPQAGSAEQNARANLARLQRGVEQAAESVLGDDTQSLQRAQQELEKLADQIGRELAQQSGSPGVNPNSNAKAGSQTTPEKSSDSTQPGSTPSTQPGNGQAQAGQPSASNREGGQPGAGTQPSNANASSPGSQGSGNDTAANPSPSPGERANPTGNPRGNQPQRGNSGGGGTGPGNFDLRNLENFVNGGGRGGSGPLTGEDFAPWSDRLRDVEDMVEDPALRSQLAAARERARLTRLEFKRELKKPDWAVVQLQILKPLVEVQNQIRDELRRRDPGDALLPIDRDPVPPRYAELVRRYYEKLGKDNE